MTNATPGAARTFNNRLVLITGAGSGLGFECAKLFASHGARLLLTGRDSAKLQRACEQLKTEYAAQAWQLAGDVSDSAFAEQAVVFANCELDCPVDILINNAGTILRSDASNTSDSEWQHVMDTNLNGLFYFSRAFANQTHDGGAIINVSSTCGQVGAAGLAAYCASKGAVNQLTKTMALELAGRKINVNAVAPGAINSPMLFSQHQTQELADSVVERNRNSIPIGEVAQPQEVARAVLFLASERHITGEIMAVDGGYTAA